MMSELYFVQIWLIPIEEILMYGQSTQMEPTLNGLLTLMDLMDSQCSVLTENILYLHPTVTKQKQATPIYLLQNGSINTIIIIIGANCPLTK